MHSVVGVLGLVALLAAVVLGMRGAERGVARLVGLPTFRWFEAGTAPSWWWKRLVVRTASAMVPFAICVTIFFVVYAIGGVAEPTTTVTVLPEGAARDAGMANGDKVLAVGGVPVHTWDELRAQIQTHVDPVQLALERSGKRFELSVTPRSGRIGIAPVSVMRRASVGEAASRSARRPIEVVTSAAKGFLAWHEHTELKGPVGIVRETSTAAHEGWSNVLLFLGLLGSYFWPFIAAVHVFDAATGWTFRTTFTETNLPEQIIRVARLRFSMHFALGCWLAALLAQLAVGAEVPGARLLIGLLMPGVWALWPLLWISARELFGKSSLLGVLLPVSLVPCVAPILGVWLALQLRTEERRRRSHQQPLGNSTGSLVSDEIP